VADQPVDVVVHEITDCSWDTLRESSQTDNQTVSTGSMTAAAKGHLVRDKAVTRSDTRRRRRQRRQESAASLEALSVAGNYSNLLAESANSGSARSVARAGGSEQRSPFPDVDALQSTLSQLERENLFLGEAEGY